MKKATSKTNARTNPYLGQDARIVCVFQNIDGRMGYALKTATQTVAISADKRLLIDLASDRFMNVTEIED